MLPSTKPSSFHYPQFLLVVLALIGTAFSMNANAHALDFASLNLKQMTENLWQVHFQQTNNVAKPPPARQGPSSELGLQLPKHCQTDFGRFAVGSNNQESSHWQVTCSNGQPLEWMGIKGSNQSQIFFYRETLDGAVKEQLYEAGTTRFELFSAQLREAVPINDRKATSYLIMGITHIAVGFDHLAFVLLATLIAATFKAIIMVITAFTAGHCLTIVLASLNLVSINQAYVEWLIALSIVFLAVEIIRERDTLTLRKPALVALLFGLVHGLGFASVLAEAGLPAENRILSLALFNVGVEIGQLLFVLLCAPLVYWLTKQATAWPKKTFVYSVGSVAGYWVIARAMML